MNTLFQRPDRINNSLFVVSPIFNPVRYKTRWKLYEDFAKRVTEAGAILYTAEAAFGERDFVVTNPSNPNHVQLRCNNELWLKENMINIGISRLPLDAKYIAWIDADVQFVRDDWVDETLHQLQHYPIIQMFSESQDLSPDYQTLRTFKSYAWCYKNDIPQDAANAYHLQQLARQHYWHPGYAWAIRKETLNAIGGLIDWAILGGADLFMAKAISGHLDEKRMPASLGQAGVKWLRIWQERVDTVIKRNLGYMDGLLLHHWHGKKINRAYKDRGQVLVDANFNPEVDLYKDSQGLWQLNPSNIKLRDGIRTYFRQRNEDDISIGE